MLRVVLNFISGGVESAIEGCGAKILDKAEASFVFEVKEEDNVALCFVTWSSFSVSLSIWWEQKGDSLFLHLPSKFIAVAHVLHTALVQGPLGV